MAGDLEREARLSLRMQKIFTFHGFQNAIPKLPVTDRCLEAGLVYGEASIFTG